MHKIGDILDKSKKINRMSHLHAYQTHKKRVCTKKVFFDTPSSILIPRYYNSFDIRLIQAERPSLISLAVTATSYMEGSQPFIYRCAPRGTRTCPLSRFEHRVWR